MAIQALNVEGSRINEEYVYAPFVVGRRREYVYEYLQQKGISSFSEITADDLIDYIKKVREDFRFNGNLYSSYKGNLEILLFAYERGKENPLISSISVILSDSPAFRKVSTFLISKRVKTLTDITADLRIEYKEYLDLSVPTKVGEYLKALDLLKLHAIKKVRFLRKLKYSNHLLFLGYYPDYELAKRFYYTARKEFLFFDFSRPVSEILKRQVFSVLKSDLLKMGERSNHYQIQQFITPLFYLYNYCCSHDIKDIKKVMASDVEDFNNYIVLAMDAKSKSASQVMYRARKQLFLIDRAPDYSATAWFMERFHFPETRQNKTRGIDAFYFDDIYDASDRAIFQNYMKYLLVLSPKLSLKSILVKYTELKRFITFFQARGQTICTCTKEDIDEYIDFKEHLNIKAKTFNNELSILASFMDVIRVREGLNVPSFPFEYHYIKTVHSHINRTVPEETINAILSVLPDFSETVGLMFLTLYCTGLRINEVCSLKKDSFFLNNNTEMLRIYQHKMKADKIIPIPEELYKQLNRHIKLVDAESIYMFPGIRNPKGPYQVATFVKQMKKQLLKFEGTSDIAFKSHDYRHTMATDMHKAGGKLATIRAFLGHKRDDMTRQYIDYLSEEVNKLQEEYFKENGL